MDNSFQRHKVAHNDKTKTLSQAFGSSRKLKEKPTSFFFCEKENQSSQNSPSSELQQQKASANIFIREQNQPIKHHSTIQNLQRVDNLIHHDQFSSTIRNNKIQQEEPKFKLQINPSDIKQFVSDRTVALQQLLVEKEIENEQLQMNLKRFQNEKDNQIQSNQDEGKVRILMIKNESLTSELNNIKNVRVTIENINQEMQSICESQQEKISYLKVELEREQQDKEINEKSLNNQLDELRNQQKQFQRDREENTSLKLKLNSQKLQIDEQNQWKQQFSKEKKLIHNQLSNNMDGLKLQNQTLRDEIDQLQNQFVQLKSDNQLLVEENSQLQEQFRQVDNENQNLLTKQKLFDKQQTMNQKGYQAKLEELNEQLSILRNELKSERELNSFNYGQQEQSKVSMQKLQKKLPDMEKQKQEIELQYEIQSEHLKKLQSLANEKTVTIEQLSKQVKELNYHKEDNKMLQNDIEQLGRQYEEFQRENISINKYTKKQLEDAKEQIQCLQKAIEEKNMQSNEKQRQIKNMERRIIELESAEEQSSEGVRFCMEGQLEEKLGWENRFDEQHRQNIELTELNDQLQGQTQDLIQKVTVYQKNEENYFQDLRVQIEAQLSQKYIQDKANMERVFWQIQQKNKDLEEQLCIQQQSRSQTQIELDEMTKQFNSIRGKANQALNLDLQVKTLSQENDKLKGFMEKQISEIGYLRNMQQQFEQMRTYFSEIEKKYNFSLQENEKIKQILVERCKNNW